MRTRVKKIMAWSSVLIITPPLALFLHVYMVTCFPVQPAGNWHLTRIEFSQVPLDSLTAASALQIIDQIPGVLNSYLNQEKGTLVYATAAGSYQSEEVFNRFIQTGSFEATRYIPEEGPLPSESCPVLNKRSLSYRMGAFFHDLLSEDKNK